MRKHLLLLAALCVPCLLLAEHFDFPIDRIDQTLRYIAIDTSDVTFRTDRVDLDSFRLAIVDELTLHPLAIPEYLKRRADSLLDTTAGLVQLYRGLIIDLFQRTTDLLHPEMLPELDPSFPTALSEGQTEAHLAGMLEILINRMAVLQSDHTGVYAKLTDSERAFLTDSFKVFLLEEEEAMNRSVAEGDSLQKLEGYLAGRLKNFGHRIDMEGLLIVNRLIVHSADDIVRWLRTSRVLADMSEQRRERFFPPTDTEVGRVVIGSRGNDRYEGKYAVIIDLGGDDEYLLEYDPEHPNQIIIDLDGNDRYYAQTDHCLGAGFMGCGILDDWAGDDIYFANHFSLGCGLFGTGILIDRGGDDLYRGDICTQGASSFGIGMLLDYEGNDSYSAHLFSQAFAFIMGASALVDHSGNDVYTAGWKYGDVLRYEDHYLSLSQGFGYGLRPHFSGGVAFLVDGGGNDQYSADIFAQGASYWWAFGGLIDYSGSDRYIAHQYAQGSATHLCLAALVDIEGDDLYSSKGVSQGCGHDLAFGLLLDCHGNDQYNAFDLSQAAGSANGVGMLIDLSGNDGHMARVKKNTHGYGNPRREYGSIGLFLDLGGSDDYRGYGANNSYWVTDSKWGIGADLEPDGEDED
jgi:hypothetical protein